MKRAIRKFLLTLARQTLEYYFATGKKLEINESELPNEELKQKHGTFVTLHKHRQLRGCIGQVEPVQAIYLDVIDNTLSAALADHRFMPLQNEELKDVDIEISVLTKPEKLEYSSVEDLLNKLQPLRDGVIIKKGLRGATYLPQVWEGLENKEDFLSSLCMKAGLPDDAWRGGDLTVLTYETEVFREIQ